MSVCPRCNQERSRVQDENADGEVTYTCVQCNIFWKDLQAEPQSKDQPVKDNPLEGASRAGAALCGSIARIP